MPKQLRVAQKRALMRMNREYFNLRTQNLPDDYFILGIDFSLNATGFCIIDQDMQIIESSTTRHLRPRKNPLSVIQKLSAIDTEIGRYLEKYDPKVVCYESITVGGASGQFHSARVLSFACGLFYSNLIKRGELPLILPFVNTQLKKSLAGSGKAEKQEMIDAVERLYSHVFEDDNQADAFACCRLYKLLRSFHDEMGEVLDGAIEEDYNNALRLFQKNGSQNFEQHEFEVMFSYTQSFSLMRENDAKWLKENRERYSL